MEKEQSLKIKKKDEFHNLKWKTKEKNAEEEKDNTISEEEEKQKQMKKCDLQTGGQHYHFECNAV